MSYALDVNDIGRCNSHIFKSTECSLDIAGAIVEADVGVKCGRIL